MVILNRAGRAGRKGFALLLSVAMALAASGLAVAAGESAAEEPDAVLYIYTWSNYFDSGVINAFQRQYDCRVEVSYFSSNEEMLESIASGYDVVTPSSYMSSIMQRQGLLLPLEHARLPNLRHIDESILHLTSDPDMAFSVPYTVTVSGVGYDPLRVDAAALGGWDIFGNTKYAGRMVMLDDMREAVGAALKHLGHSLNTVDDAELAQAEKLLLAWKRNLSAFAVDETRLILNPRDRIVSQVYNGDAALAISEGQDIGFFVPREGTSQALDDLVIPADAVTPELAHAFINFMLEPEIAKKNMEGILYYMPNKAAASMLDPKLKDNPAFALTPAIFERCEVIRDLGDDNAKYEEIWERVRGGD